MATKQGVFYVRVVYEASSDDISHIRGIVIQAIKGLSRWVRGVNIAVIIDSENDDDKQVGIDIKGAPSPEMLKLMNEYDDDDPKEVINA